MDGDGASQKKHPLQFRWVLWYDYSQRKQNLKNWETNLNKIATFDTVEDFWRYVKPACGNYWGKREREGCGGERGLGVREERRSADMRNAESGAAG